MKSWILSLGAACVLAAGGASAAQPSLGDIYSVLATKRFVDLTHAFGPSTPH